MLMYFSGFSFFFTRSLALVCFMRCEGAFDLLSLAFSFVSFFTYIDRVKEEKKEKNFDVLEPDIGDSCDTYMNNAFKI